MVDSNQPDVDGIVAEVESLCRKLTAVQAISDAELDAIEQLLSRIDVAHARLLNSSNQQSQQQMGALLAGVERLLATVEQQASGIAHDLKNITKKRQGLGKYFATLRGK